MKAQIYGKGWMGGWMGVEEGGLIGWVNKVWCTVH